MTSQLTVFCADILLAKMRRDVAMGFGVGDADLAKLLYYLDVMERGTTMKGKLDLMSEFGEMESHRLQEMMDRMSRLVNKLAAVLGKISSTNSSLSSHLA